MRYHLGEIEVALRYCMLDVWYLLLPGTNQTVCLRDAMSLPSPNPNLTSFSSIAHELEMESDDATLSEDRPDSLKKWMICSELLYSQWWIRKYGNKECSFVIIVLIFALKWFLIVIFENGQQNLILCSGKNVRMSAFTHFSPTVWLGILMAG